MVAVKQHLHVTSIARRVMERTPHVMLAGTDADAFAGAQGFSRAELLSPEARAKWEAWRAKSATRSSPVVERLRALRASKAPKRS